MPNMLLNVCLELLDLISPKFMGMYQYCPHYSDEAVELGLKLAVLSHSTIDIIPWFSS